MNTYRKTALTVGILFIIATGTSILGTFGLLEPVLWLFTLSGATSVIIMMETA